MRIAVSQKDIAELRIFKTGEATLHLHGAFSPDQKQLYEQRAKEIVSRYERPTQTHIGHFRNIDHIVMCSADNLDVRQFVWTGNTMKSRKIPSKGK